MGKYALATEYTIYIALYNTTVLSIEQWTNMLACAAVHFLKLKRGTNQSLADAFGQKQNENPIVVFFIKPQLNVTVSEQNLFVQSQF